MVQDVLTSYFLLQPFMHQQVCEHMQRVGHRRPAYNEVISKFLRRTVWERPGIH